mmetsp:Transcript_67719/g.195748  ORF Transcript_67719/g.195748 Transcript_67719/m.195748 type:complete len:272 (-) Transcript_67719:717-1532(-)
MPLPPCGLGTRVMFPRACRPQRRSPRKRRRGWRTSSSSRSRRWITMTARRRRSARPAGVRRRRPCPAGPWMRPRLPSACCARWWAASSGTRSGCCLAHAAVRQEVTTSGLMSSAWLWLRPAWSPGMWWSSWPAFLGRRRRRDWRTAWRRCPWRCARICGRRRPSSWACCAAAHRRPTAAPGSCRSRSRADSGGLAWRPLDVGRQAATTRLPQISTVGVGRSGRRRSAVLSRSHRWCWTTCCALHGRSPGSRPATPCRGRTHPRCWRGMSAS